jgi:site-specific recombinase XerD
VTCRTGERRFADGGTADLDDLAAYLVDWELHLRALNRAPSTISSYLTCGRELLNYLNTAGRPTQVAVISRSDLVGYFADMADRPNVSAATVAKHYRSLQQLFRFLHETDAIDRNPYATLRPPTVPEKPVPVLTEDDIAKLLTACTGKEFVNVRDAAMIRLLLDSGIRRAELMGLLVSDLDFDQSTALLQARAAVTAQSAPRPPVLATSTRISSATRSPTRGCTPAARKGI